MQWRQEKVTCVSDNIVESLLKELDFEINH